MAISFEQARQIVFDVMHPEWEADGEGELFVVSADGAENDDFWQILFGDRRWLIDGDAAFRPIRGVTGFISKEDGSWLDVPPFVVAVSNPTLLRFYESFTPVSGGEAEPV